MTFTGLYEQFPQPIRGKVQQVGFTGLLKGGLPVDLPGPFIGREAIEGLRKRVIRADRALICCAQNALGVVGRFTTLLNDMENVMDGAAREFHGEGMGFVRTPEGPRIAPLDPRTMQPVGVGRAIGIVIVLAVAERLLNWAQTKAAWDILDTIGTIVGKLLDDQPNSCYQCTVSQLLFAGKQRLRIRRNVNTRVPFRHPKGRKQLR